MKTIILIASILTSLNLSAAQWCGGQIVDVSCRVHFHDNIDQACIRFFSEFTADVTLVSKNGANQTQMANVNNFMGYPEINLFGGEKLNLGYQQFTDSNFRTYSMTCRK